MDHFKCGLNLLGATAAAATLDGVSERDRLLCL